jgi:foldase protein PrsA
VAGTPISGSDYADAVQQISVQLAHQTPPPGQSKPTEQQIRTSALNNLIVNAVAANYAHHHSLAVRPAEVQTQIASIEKQVGGAQKFAAALANYGFTDATFQKYIAAQLLLRKIETQVAPLPATVEEVQARHILVATKALADKLYAQLKHDPSQFAALAKKYSTDKGSAAQGGELGFFGRGVMVPQFEQAAFALKVGQISSPVHSQFGYHIIQVEAHKSVPFAQAGQTVQQPYLQRQQSTLQQWYTTERNNDHVRVLAAGVTIPS